MKNQRLFYIALAVLILGLSGGLFWKANRLRETTVQKIPVKAKANPAPSQPPATAATAFRPALPPGWKVLSVDAMIASPAGQARIQQFQQGWDASNSKLLDFYGKAIDQYGDPVPNVKVRAGVGLYVSFDRSGGKDYFTETDAQGRFSFVGIHGAGVGFWLQKEGYSYNQSLPSSSRPDDYAPDADKPTIFTMWKQQGAEPMVHWQLDSRVPYDGQSATFDLFSGKKTTVGDLRVTLTRNPLQLKQGGDLFDWSVQLVMSGGGMVEATDPYKNLAPEAGYEPVLVFTQTKNDPKWTRSLTKTFYVRLSKGQYGRVLIDLTMNSLRPDTGISIESWINPAGSRNLEFDEAKVIKPK